MNFGEDYAKAYDAFYRTKDYAGEAKFVCDQLHKIMGNVPLKILDVGCGTGLHDVEFISAGHTVFGVDTSTQMLAQATERRGTLPTALQHRLEFTLGDARALGLGKTFDAAVSLFHVMSYMADDGDFEAALAAIRSHLNPGGAFLFDFWYGPAVLAAPPQKRERVVEEAGTHIRRTTTPHHDHSTDLVRIVFDVEKTDLATAKVSHASEEHVMRYFFEEGLEKSLSAARFETIEICEWLTGHLPTETSFGVYVLAKAI